MILDPGLFWHTIVIRRRDNRAIIGPTEVPFYSFNSCSSQMMENYYVWFPEGMALKRKKLHIQITKKLEMNDPVFRAKLAKRTWHDYYGEPTWPNNLLYIYPVADQGP